MTNKNNNNTKPVRMPKDRFIASAIVIISVITLTIITLFVVRSHMEKKCWSELKWATKAADLQMETIVDDTFSYLENVGGLLAKLPDITGEDAIDEVARCRIGDLQMEMRLYLPDGRAIIGTKLVSNVSESIKYADIINSLDGEERYISTVQNDLADPEVQVLEFFSPIRKNGQIIALASAVTKISDLVNHIMSTAYDGDSFIFCSDIRDGSAFIDTTHKTPSSLDSIRRKFDKNGKSLQSYYEDVMNRKEVYTTVMSERYNVPGYLYSLPSQAYEYWSVTVGAADSIAFESANYVRRILIDLTIAEVVIFLFYIIWVSIRQKRETSKLVETAEDATAKAAEQIELQKILAENNARILALADNFVSLYDLDLETGHYATYVRSHILSQDKVDIMVNENDFFEDTIKNAERVIYPEDREGVIKALSRDFILETLEKENSYDYHYRLMMENGTAWARMRFTYKDADKTHIIVGVFNAEEEMKAKKVAELQRTMNIIFSLADEFDPIIVFDPESGEYDWYNSKAAEIERNTPMSAHGTCLYDDLEITCKTVIHEDDREQFAAFYTKENMKEIAKTGEVRETENRWYVKEAEQYLWKYNKAVRMVDESGKTYIVVGVVDTTEAKKKEAQYEEQQRQLNSALDLANQQRHIKAFGDMVNAALWSMNINDDDEVIDVYWSNELRHMLGYKEDSEEFRNDMETWTKHVHPDDIGRVRRHFHEAIESHDTSGFVYDSQYRMRRKTGEYYWYRAVGRMEYNEDGTRKLYGIFYDITADRMLEAKQEELQEALDMAQAANRAKTAFLFNMSHDIRTPMNAILGYADMSLNHVNDPDATRSYLHKLKSSGEHLLNLINDILEMSRIEAGKLELLEEPMNIRDTIERIDNIGQALAMPKNIDFAVSVGPIRNQYVRSDELHLEEVLINILSNAMKYTREDGTVRYTVNQISSVKDGKTWFRFEIADNGIGMSEEFRKHIFETFSREKTATVSKQEGTGLGLSIVKRIVDLAGGKIDVQSQPGHGTTVIVDLPMQVMDEAAIEEYKSKQTEAPEYRRKGLLKGSKVLLVEDNEMNREIAEDILGEAGLIIESAEDGSVAVNMVKEKGISYYDLILMDIQMPVMDGYEATRTIRALPDGNKIPIIAVSANAFEEDIQKSLESGMNAHIAKPIHVDELFSVVTRFM